MTDLDIHIPEFTIALRGYDRLQVDAYIDRLQGLLEDTEERLRILEPGDHRHEVGPRITQIFDLATAEAQDITAGAEEEAARVLKAARDEARAVVEANQAEWEGMLGEYEAERERIRREVDELRGQKATVIEEVRRLHQALGAASGLGSAPLPAAEFDRPQVYDGQTQLLGPAEVDPGTREFESDEDPGTREFEPVEDLGTREFETLELPPDLREAG